ncbi:MAG: hypothetical protein LBS44_00955 [Deltaproteobacteria bacterium]|jgi:nucleoside phosphorylase|nr:hypothetical protein [Deltaproteobacteria bacterium]
MQGKVAKEIVIFTSTPNEYRSVSDHVGRVAFENLVCSVLECGPGRINASFFVAKELTPRLSGQNQQIIMVGAGTSGSLSMSLKQGEVIVSNSAIISDWRMEDGNEVTVSPYGWFDYRPAEPYHIQKMAIDCQDPLIIRLMEQLPSQSLKKGRFLTSEAFVVGKENKLNKGTIFDCLACDMESGVYGFIGSRLLNLPWFNIRVVADTLDEDLGDYFAKERDMTQILGQKIVETLQLLDSLLY